jgi:MFS family permease
MQQPVLLIRYNYYIMLNKLFQQSDIPPKYHSNFIHLYLDIAWFGVLSGSAVNFLSIYATRLGATGFQIGMLSAVSAIINLMLAIPAGYWIEQRPIGRAVFSTSVYYRLGFLLWIFLPWMFTNQQQIWALIGITFLMAIPFTPLSVGFNALFAASVPIQYRAHVAGIRNVTLAITYMLTSLLSGYLLKNIPFPTGYQIVFAIGFFGAAMSSLHLYFIKPLPAESTAPQTAPVLRPTEASKDASISQARPARGILSALRLDIWSTPFRNILLALLAFHLTYYITTPLYPLFNVHILKLNDNNIGIGTALYYLTMLIGSTQFRRVAHRYGNKTVTALGVMGMALYPFLLALSHEVWQFYGISFLGGFTWAMVGGAYANYMLEHIPHDDLPAHLAWYNIVLNFSILASSLLGPAVAGLIGLAPALIVFGILRVIAGVVILKWG